MHLNYKIVRMSLSHIRYHLLVVFVPGEGKWTGTEEPVVSESDVSQTDTVQVWFLGSVLCVPWLIFGPSEVPGCLGSRHRHLTKSQFFMFYKLSLNLLVNMNIFLFNLSQHFLCPSQIWWKSFILLKLLS